MPEFTLPVPFLTQEGEVIRGVIDSSSLPNSVLTRAQADRFIDLVVNESRLLPLLRRMKVTKPKGEVNKLNINTIVSEGARATSRLVASTVTEDVMTYDTVKYRSGIDIRTDFEEDNLEGAGIRDTIMGMFTKAIANDQEYALISGDEDLPVGDNQTKENNLLGVNDGLHKILLNNVPSAQIVDAAGAAPSKDLYYDMITAIPRRFRIARPRYKFMVPCPAFDLWAYDWTDRITPGGDDVLKSGRCAGPFGQELVEINMFPTDLTYGSSDQYSDGSFMWLTPPENLVYFMQREITIEWQRKPRQDLWEATIHWRIDCEVDDPDMVVIAKNVGTDPGATAYTRS